MRSVRFWIWRIILVKNHINVMAMRKKPIAGKGRFGILLTSIILLAIGSILLWQNSPYRTPPEFAPVKFDGQRALADVAHQADMGPRTPGSAAHVNVRAWMREELEAAGWQVEEQVAEKMGHPIYNLIAYRTDAPPEIILGAHYDCRIYADHDPDLSKRKQAVPGANDGASGVAVLLELARSIPKESASIWLVFFDAEDNGNIPGWDWILGSRAFVEGYEIAPQAVVIVDMIGDADLNIYKEKNSNPELTAEIWAQAAELGYEDVFIPEEKWGMLDDHTPFLEAGIPAMDIIDFDYPYWHTTADTTDKISAQSLQAVGDTILGWLKSRK